MFTKKELALAPEMINILEKSNQVVPEALRELKKMAAHVKAENKYRKWRKNDGGNNNFGTRNFGNVSFGNKSQAVDQNNRGQPQFSERPAYVNE